MRTDGLTGVANRRHLDERLQNDLEKAQRYGSLLSVIMADIDNFKRINDSYGHLKGDEVILAFTAVLNECVRSADFVARFGGEEFFIILPETDRAGAELLAERIRVAMQAKKIEGVPYPVTASFGLTEVLKNDALERIVQRADQALYQAKEAGRNRVVSI